MPSMRLAMRLSVKRLSEGQGEGGERYIGMYKTIAEIPENTLTFLWHVPCLRSGWHELGSKSN